MNYLQIWIGKLPKNVLDNMTLLLSMVKQDEKYYLISSKNYFENDSRVEWININIIKKLLVDAYPCLKNFWNKLVVQHQSDIIRFHMLSKIEDLLYVDTDIIFKDSNIIDSKDSIYLTLFRKLFYDFNIIYNGDIEFFKKFFDFLIKNLEVRDVEDIRYEFVFRKINRFIMNNNVSLQTIDINKFEIRN